MFADDLEQSAVSATRMQMALMCGVPAGSWGPALACVACIQNFGSFAHRTCSLRAEVLLILVCIWRLVCDLKKRVGLPVSVVSLSSADLLALSRHLTSSASQLRLR